MTASGLLTLVAGVAAIVLVQRVTQMQTRRTHELWAEGGPPLAAAGPPMQHYPPVVGG